MTITAAHADAFFIEATQSGAVWAIRDEAGFPAATNSSDETVMPFWSLESRARRIIDQVSAYGGFTPHKLPLEVFADRWLKGLQKDNVRVGINWSGVRATGFDIAPADVLQRLQHALNALASHTPAEKHVTRLT